MGFFEKLKLLFKVQGPVTNLVTEAKEAKKSKKWLHFSVVLIGTIGSTVAALTGIIPAPAQLVIATVSQALYNILRGADKADSEEVKGTLRTSEFWLSALTEIQKGIVATQAGGINPEWLVTASTVVGMSLAAGQNLAARTPSKTE